MAMPVFGAHQWYSETYKDEPFLINTQNSAWKQWPMFRNLFYLWREKNSGYILKTHVGEFNLKW